MKCIFFIAVLYRIFSQDVQAQTPNEKEVAKAVEVFRKGIVDADKNTLLYITADKLVYGHSGGKVQNKAEFIEEILSQKPFDYTTAEISDQTITVSGKTAIVRHIFAAQTMSNGIAANLKIGIMQVWQKQSGKWKLLGRQAYKLP